MSVQADGTRTDHNGDQPDLRRVMGPKLLLLFIVGDILGTGVYALTGQVAGEVGGAAWAPFLVAFAVAPVTAVSYLALVTRYPQAAGAALYAHKAFGVHFLTFLVAFTVMCSGITSASTAATAFGGFVNDGFGFDLSTGVVLFKSGEDKGVFFAVTAATSLAFFAMVGFEDSVNMAEECHDPRRDFPKMMLTGLGITGLIYALVSITAVALVPVGDLTDESKGSALTQVVAAGAPGLPFDTIFPFIGMFAVANSALINMLMASRLLYGLANQDVLPRSLGKVHPVRRTPWVSIAFTTAIAFGLIVYVVRAGGSADGATTVEPLGGTTSLLLLCVFTVVNVALLVLRRRPVDHDHFTVPAFLPVVGAVTCAFLAGPWARSEDQMQQYEIAGYLLAVGVVLWLFTWLLNRGLRAKRTGFRDVDSISG